MGTICSCSTNSPGNFTSHSKQLIKDFFSILSQRKVLAHTFFFFSFSLIASNDLNAPCRLMPGTACWLDIPEFGSDIRLLEMKLSFLHLLSIFFFLTSLLEYNSFTVVCSFLLYNKVNQLYMYIYPHIPSLSHLPPTLPIPPSPPPHPTAWSVHTWERAGLCAY